MAQRHLRHQSTTPRCDGGLGVASAGRAGRHEGPAMLNGLPRCHVPERAPVMIRGDRHRHHPKAEPGPACPCLSRSRRPPREPHRQAKERPDCGVVDRSVVLGRQAGGKTLTRQDGVGPLREQRAQFGVYLCHRIFINQTAPRRVKVGGSDSAGPARRVEKAPRPLSMEGSGANQKSFRSNDRTSAALRLIRKCCPFAIFRTVPFDNLMYLTLAWRAY
jgi:hypothetical protein